MAPKTQPTRRWVLHASNAGESGCARIYNNYFSQWDGRFGCRYVVLGTRPESNPAHAGPPRHAIHGHVELDRTVTVAMMHEEFPFATWNPADLSASECAGFIQALCTDVIGRGTPRAELLRAGVTPE